MQTYVACASHIPAPAPLHREDSDRLIETGRHKLFPSGGVVHVKYCRDVIHVDLNRCVQGTHIKSIQAVKHH